METPALPSADTTSKRPLVLQRSHVADNPLRAINRRSVHGRMIHAIVARLLANVDDPGDPLVIADCIALAELRVRADQARRDPVSDPDALVRLEGLIDRRTKRLGVARSKPSSSALPSLGELLARDRK
jgi:hypothetical protein